MRGSKAEAKPGDTVTIWCRVPRCAGSLCIALILVK